MNLGFNLFLIQFLKPEIFIFSWILETKDLTYFKTNFAKHFKCFHQILSFV